MSSTTGTPSIIKPGHPLYGLDVVTLDFETFWDVGYSLRQIPTSEYIRDSRFKSHGVGIRHADGEEVWVSGQEERERLHGIDWGKTALLCQNTQFDGFILHEHFGIHPASYLDTLSMSRAEWGVFTKHDLTSIGIRCGFGGKIGKDVLNTTKGIRDLDPEQYEKMGEYCKRDVQLTYAIFMYLLAEEFPPEELPIIDTTLRAFCDPRLRINRKLAEEELADEVADKKRLLEREGVTAEDVQSNPKFADLLRARGMREDEIPVKWSEKQQKHTYAFAKSDEDFTDLLHDPTVAGLVEARLRVKSTIAESRARRLIVHGDPGPLPICMNYWKAHTGRWGGGDKLNPQNFPAGRNGQTLRLRNSILPPPGFVFIIVDSSQIEPRTLAWFAGDEELLEVFRSGKDPYLHMASVLYQEDYDDPKKYARERRLGKGIVIALPYGMGVNKFIVTCKVQFGLEITRKQAEVAHSLYRQKRTKIMDFWDLMDQGIIRMAQWDSDSKELPIKGGAYFGDKALWMTNRCALRYPNLRRVGNNFYYRARKRWQSLYAGKQTENFTQGEARHIVATQAVAISQRYYIALLAHDEVVYLAPENETEEALQFGIDAMSVPPTYAPDLPVAATGLISPCYTHD